MVLFTLRDCDCDSDWGWKVFKACMELDKLHKEI